MKIFMGMPVDFDLYGTDSYLALLEQDARAADNDVLLTCFMRRPTFDLCEQNGIRWEFTHLADCVVFPDLCDEDYVALKLASTDEMFLLERDVPLTTGSNIAPAKA